MSDLHDRFPKFYALEEEKQTRIINAAMSEFLHGFKEAKTDNIVREAGISKGLLFHYFGTKEQLFGFLIDHAIDIIQAEFIELINVTEQDVLAFVWQAALLKLDVSKRFPVMFDFIAHSYLDTRHTMAAAQAEHMARFIEMRHRAMNMAMANCDMSLFRDGIDPHRAIELINWALAGYGEARAHAERAKETRETRENYEQYLDEFREYLTILRKCFYKEEGSA